MCAASLFTLISAARIYPVCETSRHQRLQATPVVGAGIGGLLAGRVLAGYFDRVTILERDVLPYEPASRKGVPPSCLQ